MAELSAGQKRRTALARLLVTGRALWLLDEPTVSLDAENTARFGAAVTAHLALGGMAVLATHIDLGFQAETLDVSQFAAKHRATDDPFAWEASGVRAVIARDLALAFRAGGGFGLALAFFLITVTLVPIGVGPDTETLRLIAPGHPLDRCASELPAVARPDLSARLGGWLA